MAKNLKLAINIILGEETASAAEIAAALRAQADALSPAQDTAPVKKVKKTKPAKDEDDDTDNEDHTADETDDDSDGDDSDGASGVEEENSDDEDHDGSSGEDESETDDEEDEKPKGPSKQEVLKTLKLVASKKKKSVAVGVMKKVTGKDSIHDVKPALLGKLHKALKAALK